MSASRQYSALAYDITPLSEAERLSYAATLTEEQRRILLAHGTEAPFCGTLLDNKQEGRYACALCGLPLFSSIHKFDSGTGWPSFYSAVDRTHLHFIRDTSYGMVRIEIRCARCEGHLGHVFPDGPPPSFERYCLNSEAMTFFPNGVEPEQRLAGA